jgi:dTDP-4-amino-4,6-dideoxygalactose transaminase
LNERRPKFLPFSRPTLEDDEVEEVVDSLRSGWITSGPKVERFEGMFRERLRVEHAVAVNSATAGLHLAVAALDLKPGEEVIVPSITWASSANVVELCGGSAVFADVDPRTLCLDPEAAASRVTERTRAIIPVHFAGQPVDLAALRGLARARGLELIQDAAHALGTVYDGEEVGSSGEVTVFSFHPIKNITTGEGGMIVLNDSARADAFRLLRFHGVSRDAWKRYQRAQVPEYDIIRPGWKYNMLDIQAALGIRQLTKLDRFNAMRRERAKRYDELLAGIPEITPLGRVPYPAAHAWHLYIVRLDTDAISMGRSELMQALGEENIGTGLHFPPLHLSRYYREKYGYGPGSFPNAEKAGERIFSLPLYPLLTEDDQRDVVHALQRIIARHRR